MTTPDAIWPTVCAYLGAGLSVAAGYAQQAQPVLDYILEAEPVTVVGIGLAAGTFLVNWHYKRKILKLNQEMRDDYLRRHQADTRPAPLGMDG